MGAGQHGGRAAWGRTTRTAPRAVANLRAGQVEGVAEVVHAHVMLSSHRIHVELVTEDLALQIAPLPTVEEWQVGVREYHDTRIEDARAPDALSRAARRRAAGGAIEGTGGAGVHAVPPLRVVALIDGADRRARHRREHIRRARRQQHVVVNKKQTAVAPQIVLQHRQLKEVGVGAAAQRVVPPGEAGVREGVDDDKVGADPSRVRLHRQLRYCKVRTLSDGEGHDEPPPAHIAALRAGGGACAAVERATAAVQRRYAACTRREVVTLVARVVWRLSLLLLLLPTFMPAITPPTTVRGRLIYRPWSRHTADRAARCGLRSHVALEVGLTVAGGGTEISIRRGGRKERPADGSEEEHVEANQTKPPPRAWRRWRQHLQHLVHSHTRRGVGPTGTSYPGELVGETFTRFIFVTGYRKDCMFSLPYNMPRLLPTEKHYRADLDKNYLDAFRANGRNDGLAVLEYSMSNYSMPKGGYVRPVVHVLRRGRQWWYLNGPDRRALLAVDGRGLLGLRLGPHPHPDAKPAVLFVVLARAELRQAAADQRLRPAVRG